MDKITLYLNELYIQENFTSWAKQLIDKKIIDKFKTAVDKKDKTTVKNILSKIPQAEPGTLHRFGKIAHKDFDKVYNVVFKEAQKGFGSDEKMQKYLSVMMTSKFIMLKQKDIRSAAQKEFQMLNKKLKNTNLTESMVSGFAVLILAGAFVATSIATMSLFPLLVAIILVGLTSIMVMESLHT